MKKIIVLLLFSSVAIAQNKIRTFDQYAISYGLNDNVSTTSLYLGQEMVIGDDFHYSFGAFVRLNWNRLQAQSISSKGNLASEELEILDRASVLSLSIPLSATIGYKRVSLGGSFDLASWTMGKNLSSDRFGLSSASEGLIARPNGVGWVLGRAESMKNLSNQLFFSYNFEHEIAIRIGMTSQHISYDLRNRDTDGGIGSRENIFGKTYIYPFISIRFNNEK